MMRYPVWMMVRRVSFDDIAQSWLDYVKTARKPTTYDKYQGIYKKYISPFIKDMPYKKIDNNSVKTIYSEKIRPVGMDKSTSIQKMIIIVLNQILSYGNENYNLDLIRIKSSIPKSICPTAEIFSDDEQKKLIKYVNSDINVSKLGILLCLFTGLRLGEICALRWEDIDMQRGTLNVCRTVHRVSAKNGNFKTKLTIDLPKSKSSNRVIPLPDDLIVILNNQQNCGGYLLHSSKPTDPRTFEYRFDKMLKECGITHKNFHVLRHTFATNCILNGMDMKSLSEILGHSSVQITMDRYVHPLMEQKRVHMNRLFSMFKVYCA